MGKIDPKVDIRKFGLELVGNIVWGTHLCQFYETKRDLIDILIPYFIEGLSSNEFCMWVTSPPLDVDEAKKALKKRVPDLERYIEKGQMEIISYVDWYLLGGKFDAERVLQGLIEKEKKALEKGFVGLRLTCNTFWIERKDWKSFADCEANVNTVIGSHRMIALCTYSLKKCKGTDVVGVIRNHVGALIRKGEAWNLMEDATSHKRAENGIDRSIEKAEERLQENEALLRSFFDSPGIMRGIVETIDDVDIRHIRDNEVTASYLGLTSADLQGKLSSELGEPAERIRMWLDHYKKSQLSGQPTRFEYADKQSSNTSWLAATVTYLGTSSSRHPRFAYAAVDVTERKKTEQALRESEDRFRAITKTSPIQISVSRASDGVILFTNPSYDEAFGFASGELVGVQAPDLYFDPADRTKLTDALKKQGSVKDYTVRVKRKDGTPFWVAASIAPIRFGGEQALLGVSIEITDRKKAEEELRRLNEELEGRVQERTKDVSKERQRLYNVLETIPAYVVLLDKDYHVPFANKVFRERFGESHGRNCYDYLFNRSSPCQNCESYKVLKTNTPHHWDWIGPDDRNYDVYDFPFVEADGSTLILEMGLDVTDRKRAEAELKKHQEHLEELIKERTKKLQESEARFYTAFEASPDAVAIQTASDSRFVDVNQSFLAMVEYSKDEVVGHTSIELNINAEPDRHAQIIRALAEQGSVRYFENVYRTKTGRLITVLLSSETILLNGQTHYISTVTDITERKKIENQLRETRDYLDSLLNYANAPIIVWDRQFKITMFNRAFERLTGFVSSDVIGKHLDLLFPAEKKSEAMAHIQRALEGEYWEAVEIPILHKDGTVKTALWNSANIHDPANKTIIATIAQGQDITGRKKAEEALRETRDYLDSLLNYANAPIIVWDPEFKITMFNHAFEHLTGLTSNEAVGKPLGILFPKEQKEEAMSHIQRTLAGEQWETVEIPILHKDGTVRTLLWNSANIHDSSNRKVMATIAQGQDITERKTLEAKLEQYTRHLERLVDEKTEQLKDSERLITIGQTAGMVGHDIRNPLQSIEGAVYLAKEEAKSLPSQSPEKKELEEILNIIESQTRYIDHIVADLQDFARIPIPQPTETDVGALINDALVAARIPENIQTQTVLQENLKLTIDPVFMRRVITNLIDNAIQAMPSGGKLNLMLTSDENKASISVQDTGVGIPEKDKPKIFTPLFTTKAKGQGFGLAVCKKLIEAQGGKITFVSEVGKGTLFSVTFPNKRTN